ncbi:hypothetical protein NP493_491g02006 [Ridgeia piscesae]|uniref:non-specific protein-tyrosine kinase n=1 Tax=Ridgeia piscesae TaxID=27915 RepID=A0AAD9KY13_RIDPI|nr:hypothetical protein NP493_491g02006 [Ridgeia piscesae]
MEDAISSAIEVWRENHHLGSWKEDSHRSWTETISFVKHNTVTIRTLEKMAVEEDTQWLPELLHEVQLEQFYVKLRDHLQVTRLSHFDYVKTEDLEKIGMGRPAIRRLLDAVKKHKNKNKKGILEKVQHTEWSWTHHQLL